MKLSEGIEKYMRFCIASGFASNTLKAKKEIFNRLIVALENKDLNQICADDILEFLMSANVAYSTFNCYRKDINSLWNWLYKREYVLKPIMHLVPVQKPRIDMGEMPTRKVPRWIEVEKTIWILNRMKMIGYKHYLITAILIETGARISEVLSLKRENVFEDRIFLAKTKTNEPRFLPIHEKLYSSIVQHSKMNGISEGYLFPATSDKGKSFDHSKHMDRRSFNKIFNRICKDLKQTYTGKSITPHSLRHTFAQRRVPIDTPYELQYQMGHSDAGSTMHYYDLYAPNVFDSVVEKNKHLSIFYDEKKSNKKVHSIA